MGNSSVPTKIPGPMKEGPSVIEMQAAHLRAIMDHNP